MSSISALNKTLNEEKMRFHDELNPAIWEGNKLKDKVAMKLMEIASNFVAYLDVEGFSIEDIIITGSMANYNYTEQSDIDLHIICDYSKLPTNCPILSQEYFQAKKKIYNDKHNIKIYGYDVELYVEDSTAPSLAGGKYSLLQRKWLRFPQKIDFEVDDVIGTEELQDLITQIENVCMTDGNIQEANELLNQIYEMRKSGLAKGGEFAFENLLFKALRNRGYLDKLRSYIAYAEDLSLSLNESVYPKNKYVFPYPDWGDLANIIDPNDRYRYWVDGIQAKIKNPYIKDIPVDKIRQDYDGDDDMFDYDYKDFESGINEPIEVVKYKNQYILMDGNHRAAFAKVNGFDTIKAYVYDADKLAKLNESYDYIDEIEVIINPTKKEFNDFVNKNKWYRILLTNDSIAIWSADTPLLHYQVEEEYNVTGETLFCHKGNVYFQDYDLVDVDDDMKESYIEEAEELDNNPILKQYFPNLHMKQDTIDMLSGKKVIYESYFFLNEGISDLAKQFPRIPEEKLRKFIALDPTYKGGEQAGKYGSWIIRLFYNNIKNADRMAQYREFYQQNNGINPKTGEVIQKPELLPQTPYEDAEKIPNLLKQYDVLKKEIGQPIDSFKTIPDLYAAIQQHTQKGVPQDKTALERYNVFKACEPKGLKKIYEDNQWIIGIPTTFESSKPFGEFTNWCTTSSNGYYYDRYLNQYGGEYYILLDKTDGALYQFHFESNQFMDETDHQIDMYGFTKDYNNIAKFLYNYKMENNSPEMAKNKLAEKFAEIIKDPQKIQKEILYENYTSDVAFEGDNVTGFFNLKYLSKFVYYNNSRNGMNLETVCGLLTDFYDNFSFDGYSLRDFSYQSGDWKDIAQKYGINLTWQDLCDVYDGEDSAVEDLENFGELQSLIQDDFYDNYGLLGFLQTCTEYGTQVECEKDILSSLSDNLPMYDNTINLDKDDDVITKFSISKEDLWKIYYIMNKRSDDIPEYGKEIKIEKSEKPEMKADWFEFWMSKDDDYYGDDEEAFDDWLYCWRVATDKCDVEDFDNGSFVIDEPYYGWSGFDDKYFKEGCESAAKRIAELLGVNEKKAVGESFTKAEEQPKNLNEEIVYASKKDLSDIILKNPTRKEILEYDNSSLKHQDWRIVKDNNGNYYFGSGYDWIHFEMCDALKKQGIDIDVVFADYDGIASYDSKTNTFYIRDEYGEPELIEQEFNDSYLKKAFPNAKLEIDTEYDEMLESKQLNESWSDVDDFLDIQEETRPYDVLMMYKSGENNIWYPLIKPTEYKQALNEFMKYGEIVRYPEDKIYNWLKIIFKNTCLIDSITQLAGHTEWFPYEDVKEAYEEAEDLPEKYSSFQPFLEEQGFYDWCKLPDGSDAWSDYGLKPLYNILNEYNDNMNAGQVLVLINRCLDVYHQRGDLASAFIDGGNASLTKISNESKLIKGNQLNESIMFNDEVYDDFQEEYRQLTVWVNPSIDWIRNKLNESGGFRFLHSLDKNKLYVFTVKSGFMHQQVFDMLDFDWSKNGRNVVGVFNPDNSISIWEALADDGEASSSLKLAEKLDGDLFKQIYPNGYELTICY